MTPYFDYLLKCELNKYGVSYQEEGGLAVSCGTLDVSKCLSLKRSTGNVEGEGQGHVVFRVYQQTQVGAENLPHCHF